jgi:hypothetical protein
MTDFKIKLNGTGNIDLVHYQRLAEQARAEAIHGLLLSLSRQLKQWVNSGVAAVRSVRLARMLPGSMLRHSH